MPRFNLPADLPENLEWDQIIAPEGTDIGKPEQWGYNYLLRQVNAVQRACNQLDEDIDGIDAQVEEGIAAHNTASDAHGDIRGAVAGKAGKDEVYTRDEVDGKIAAATPPAATGTATGVVRLSDAIDADLGAEAGVAASPRALKTVNETAVHRTGDETVAGVKTFECLRTNDSRVVLGLNASAAQEQTMAIGEQAAATGMFSTAVGYLSAAGGNGTAFGRESSAGQTAVALGSLAKANGHSSICVGSQAIANGASAIAIGSGTASASNNCIAIGQSASIGTSSDYAISIGSGSQSVGSRSVVLGNSAKSSSQDNIAIGYQASTAQLGAVAIGAGSRASGQNSVAIGPESITSNTENNTIWLGSTSASYVSSLKCRVGLSVTSDERDKTDISPIDKSLEFISRIDPIQFVSNARVDYLPDEEDRTEEQNRLIREYGMCDCYDREAHAAGAKKGRRKRVGVKAQQVQEALAAVYGTADYANIVNDNLHDAREKGPLPAGVESQLTVAYTEFVPFLIGAVQELAARVGQLEAVLAARGDA